jgi:hypothetical protein
MTASASASAQSSLCHYGSEAIPVYLPDSFSPYSPLRYSSLHFTIQSYPILYNPILPILYTPMLSYPMLCHLILSYPILCYVISCHLMSSHLISCHVISSHVISSIINHRHYEFGFDNFLNSDTRDGFPTRTLSAMASAVLKSCLNCSLSVRILFVYVFNICDFFLPSAALMAKSSRRNK